MLLIVLLLVVIGDVVSISSPIIPFTAYRYSTELEKGMADLWWTVDNGAKDITFELHMKTTGWIALGISPAGGMTGADIGDGWVDSAGKVYFQDRYASDFFKPAMDNTTENWLALRGRESNGWTAIQFKRLLDTCDPMDVEIKSGTNVIIYAHGLTDPSVGDISYHQNRRGSRMNPLQSYANPPTENKFADLDYFEFRLNNSIVPSDDTTYYCKVYKAPTGYSRKRHAIAHKTMIDSDNVDMVHHLVLYECDRTVEFDDNNLPEGVCDDHYKELSRCLANTGVIWAVGGDEIVEFPEEAGYPVGDRRDNTGIRFYLGKELRQYDLGYLTFGTSINALALTIPPKVAQFTVDSYCPKEFTKGDEFATRCMYNTMNKNEVTLGGERTKDEMCSHIFTYYPRINDLSECFTSNHPDAWQAVSNRVSTNFNYTELIDWIKTIEWTPALAIRWQKFYNNASRVVTYNAGNNTKSEALGVLPKYKDLPMKSCQTESV
ncbi:unnamed protein product [Rotaria socialis]|uniref:DOMON domain-containing protein n=1 Tax=Rotaria socialis TaxID=392032 RepID=A0A817UDR5_9BILA|nr:unnamed protein product [Rotaria socialis]CAF4773858.1 unnamed protein product [Rotaria socialis]